MTTEHTEAVILTIRPKVSDPDVAVAIAQLSDAEMLAELAEHNDEFSDEQFEALTRRIDDLRDLVGAYAPHVVEHDGTTYGPFVGYDDADAYIVEHGLGEAASIEVVGR